MKPQSYVLVAVLVALLLFVVGIRYGQRVEKTNKTISYLLTSAPTKPPQNPTDIPPIAYIPLTHKGCRISFLYPDTLKSVTPSSMSAEIAAHAGDDAEIAVRCARREADLEKILSQNNFATASFTFQHLAVSYAAANKSTGEVAVIVKHPRLPLYILYVVKKELYPLIEKTTEFSTN